MSCINFSERRAFWHAVTADAAVFKRGKKLEVLEFFPRRALSRLVLNPEF